jgi:hypothetical protein
MEVLSYRPRSIAAAGDPGVGLFRHQASASVAILEFEEGINRKPVISVANPF